MERSCYGKVVSKFVTNITRELLWDHATDLPFSNNSSTN